MTKRHFITLLFLTLALVAGARNYVVLVGIADYPGTKSDLKVGAQDAVTMKNLYDRNGDAVTEILTDAEATVENVRVTLGNVFSRATRDDAVILFFSGYGVPGGFVCYNGLLKYSDITMVMSHSEAQTKMVLADACFVGKARGSKKHDDKPTDTNVLFFSRRAPTRSRRSGAAGATASSPPTWNVVCEAVPTLTATALSPPASCSTL